MQTSFNSFLESLLGALIAAPTAFFLHKVTLLLIGQCVLNTCVDYYIGITWVIFLCHSIIWKYIIRRILVKTGSENLTTFIKGLRIRVFD